jgi:hypothetical protein
MSLAHVRTALETHLLAMTPALAKTVLENGPTYTPVSGTPYQMAFLLPGQPDNPALGSAYRREIGVFQVSLMYPQGVGAGTAQSRALAVQGWFKRGLVLTASSVNVLILRTPEISPGRLDGDRFRIDVSIRYQAEVFG